MGEWLSCEGGPAGAGPREWLAGRPLDVNRATATELAEIPGIGEGLARAIVAHRERQGPFATLDALTEVRGIGLRTLERARPFLHAGGAPRMPHTSSPDDMPR